MTCIVSFIGDFSIGINLNENRFESRKRIFSNFFRFFGSFSFSLSFFSIIIIIFIGIVVIIIIITTTLNQLFRCGTRSETSSLKKKDKSEIHIEIERGVFLSIPTISFSTIELTNEKGQRLDKDLENIRRTETTGTSIETSDLFRSRSISLVDKKRMFFFRVRHRLSACLPVLSCLSVDLSVVVAFPEYEINDSRIELIFIFSWILFRYVIIGNDLSIAFERKSFVGAKPIKITSTSLSSFDVQR